MNIFVANLDYAIRNEELLDIFSQHGEVLSAKIIMDHETGRSRGFGFVEMTDECATTAINALNNAEVRGKTITVKEARPKTDAPRQGGYRNDNRQRNNNWDRNNWNNNTTNTNWTDNTTNTNWDNNDNN